MFQNGRMEKCLVSESCTGGGNDQLRSSAISSRILRVADQATFVSDLGVRHFAN
jgi:hypothetical protein